MRQSDKIYVAGHRGLVGSALLRRLQSLGYSNVVTRTHADLDLTNQDAVDAFFRQERPEHVFLAAAKVGGIVANATYPADFIRQNLQIELNIIHSSFRYEAKKLLFLGSSCIYPKYAPQPMTEEHLLTGPLEPTNEAYAIAKIAGIKMCSAYNQQHGTNYLSVMPANLYGPGDNYHPQNAHVLPALIRRLHQARSRGDSTVVVWGTGTPRREFLFSDDLADACVFLMERYHARDVGEFVNVGVGTDVSIQDLAGLVAETVGYEGRFEYDTSKPDGTPRKLLDVTRLKTLGWQPTTELSKGLRVAYSDFLQRERD